MEKREYIEGQLLYIAHPYGGDIPRKNIVFPIAQLGICTI